MPGTSPDWPEAIRQIFNGAWAVLASAVIGRLMWHVRMVQIGQRRFWSLHLLWEIPTAFGMALIGAGVAEWLELAQKPMLALVATLAYLGPRGLEAILSAWLSRKTKA